MCLHCLETNCFLSLGTAAILLGIKNTFKVSIAALEQMSAGYFYSHCMKWSRTCTWVDVFHSPVLCLYQIRMLQSLKIWKTEHIDISSTSSLVTSLERRQERGGERVWDLDLHPFLTLVTSQVSAYLSSLEQEIAADTTSANDGDSMDEGNSSSESIDAKLDSTFYSTDDSPSITSASSKLTRTLAAVVDHCLLLLAVTIATTTLSSNKTSEPLFSSIQDDKSFYNELKNLMLRLLSLLGLFPSKISKELHALESRLSEAICLVLHFLPLEKDSSVTFNSSTLAGSAHLEDFLNQLWTLSQVHFAIGRINCKVAISGMVRFVCSTAILAPKVRVVYILLSMLLRYIYLH